MKPPRESVCKWQPPLSSFFALTTKLQKYHLLQIVPHSNKESIIISLLVVNWLNSFSVGKLKTSLKDQLQQYVR